MEHNLSIPGSGFGDIENEAFYRHRPPNVIIKAAQAAAAFEDMAGDDFIASKLRKVVFVDANGDKWYHELTLYKLPTGASTLTLGSYSGSTFTSNTEGKLITEAGALTTSRDDNDGIAGMLFSHYTTSRARALNPDSYVEPKWATELEAGDYIWIIRNGDCEFVADDAIADGDHLVTENGNNSVAGAVDHAVTTIASQDEVREVIPGPAGRCVGVAAEAAAAAGDKFKGKLLLGYRTLL